MLAALQSRDRWWLLAGFLLLTILRIPAVVFEGRLWAEEARVFYFHAATTPWLQALFYSYVGYLNLGANIAAVAARHLVPIDYAPRITLIFAFAAQIFPALLLVTSHDTWLRSRLALAASLWLLVAAPSAEEVWLNSPSSQFHIALCVALILALEIEPGGRELFRRILLFLAPLCGLLSIMLLPLFAVRAFLDRSRGRLVQSLVLASGSAIHLVFFYHAHPGRETLNIKLILGTIFAKNILLPFLSFDLSQPIATWLHTALSNGILPIGVVVTILLAVVVLLSLAAKGPEDSLWLVAACGAITLLSYYGALLPSPDLVEPHIGGRYAFVPQVLFAWALVAIAAASQGPRAKIAFILAAWLCVASINAYLNPPDWLAHGPQWRQEIAKWHINPSYSPMAWPGGQWVVPMPLSPHIVGTAYPAPDTEGAEQLQEDLRVRPTVEGHNNLGILLAKMPGRSADAISHFEAALRLDPNQVQPHFNLGILFAKMPGRSADAILHFEAAVRLDPDLAQAQRDLGMLLSSMPGRATEAIAHLEAAQRIQPDPELLQTINRLREKDPK